MPANPTVIESSITAATVMSSRALVTRKGRVQLVAGENRITFRDLPEALDEGSVRVAGEGPAGTRLGGVEVRREYLQEVKDERLRGLQRQIEEAVAGEATLSHDIGELNTGLGLLNELVKNSPGDLSRGYSRKRIDVNDLDKGYRWILEQLHATNGSLRAKGREMQELQKRLNQLRGEESELTSMGSKEVLVVEVGVDATTAGPFDLSMEYVVDGAAWSPRYDARVLTDESKVEFSYFGMVHQETGEHWRSTRVTLSTAPEAPTTVLPELSPWYLRAYEPERARPSKPMARSAPGMGGAGLMAKSAAPMEAPPFGFGEEPMAPPPTDKREAAQDVVARVDTSGETVVYRIPQTADLPSEDSPRKLLIGRFVLPTDISFLTVPKLVPEVYTSARVTNDSEFMLLPGAMSLFADAEFIGETAIEHVAPTERFKLSLGITKAIKVKRELVKREVSAAGMISKEKVIRFAYRIKVENNRKSDARITVKDQIPVSPHEKLKVGDIVFGDDDEPTKKSELGILEWTFKLAPEKKKIIDFGFAVNYPQDFTVDGDLD